MVCPVFTENSKLSGASNTSTMEEPRLKLPSLCPFFMSKPELTPPSFFSKKSPILYCPFTLVLRACENRHKSNQTLYKSSCKRLLNYYGMHDNYYALMWLEITRSKFTFRIKDSYFVLSSDDLPCPLKCWWSPHYRHRQLWRRKSHASIDQRGQPFRWGKTVLALS